MSKYKLIIGLGNPGSQYEKTRHNIGFIIIDEIIQLLNINNSQNNFNGTYATAVFQDTKIFFAKPLTYMNLSGNFVREICHFFKIDKKDILVIYDDVSLPIGKLRLRPEGSSGGQKGIESIIKSLGSSQFARLKIGVGPIQGNIVNFVLSNFKANEIKQILQLKEIILTTIKMFIDDQEISKIMNLVN